MTMMPLNHDIKGVVDGKLYILYDNFHGKERVVTEGQLSEAFSEERIAMLKSGNDYYWNLIDYN